MNLALEPMALGMPAECHLAGGKMDQEDLSRSYGSDMDQVITGFTFISSTASNTRGRWQPPATPVSAQLYQSFNLPWFDLYDEALGDIAPGEKMKGIKSVKEIDQAKGKTHGEDETSLDVDEDQIKKIK
jgi:hypothetical protein